MPPGTAVALCTVAVVAVPPAAPVTLKSAAPTLTMSSLNVTRKVRLSAFVVASDGVRRTIEATVGTTSAV